MNPLFKRHLKSFATTYAAVFIGIIVFADQSGTDVFQVPFLIAAAKTSLLAVLKNLYKLLTETK